MIVKKGTDGEANEILLTGSFVTTSETCDIIALGLRMVQGLVGDSAFSGRGVAGPLNIMTDDSDAEGGAIRQVWPSAHRLLCAFHLGQATWRWQRNVSSGVHENHRQGPPRRPPTRAHATSDGEANELLLKAGGADGVARHAQLVASSATATGRSRRAQLVASPATATGRAQ